MKTTKGVGLPLMVFVVFLILKLTGNIDWSWWWVLSPLWICLGLGILTAIIVFAVLKR